MVTKAVQTYMALSCDTDAAWNDGYRYGFNGKIKDNEVQGLGNSQDYGLRMYDNRLARFKSIDPLHREFPFLSTFQFAGNNPIRFIDLDGGEPKDYLPGHYYLPETVIRVADALETMNLTDRSTFNSAQMNNIKKYISRNSKQRRSPTFSGYQNANPSGTHDCITSVNNSINIILDLPSKGLWLNGSTIKKSMSELGSMGFATEVGTLFFRNTTGQTTDKSPNQRISTPELNSVAMTSTLSDMISKNLEGKELGQHMFALSMLDGYHSMLLKVDNSDRNNVKYTLMDQVSGWNSGFTSGPDKTGAIDGYVDEWARRNMNTLLDKGGGTTNQASSNITLYEIRRTQKSKKK